MKLSEQIDKINRDTANIKRIGERLNNIFKDIPKA